MAARASSTADEAMLDAQSGGPHLGGAADRATPWRRTGPGGSPCGSSPALGLDVWPAHDLLRAEGVPVAQGERSETRAALEATLRDLDQR